ncbi:MAG: DNA polymerase III subunit gamma/tau [Muribaculaceae bacterium]|nr:DNA polymerase III subunit gamma/tau [Muribaculaceae bacterium]
MEQYIVSARKYRPATFSSVVGQQALTVTLKNAIATDRLAHAYLFCGSRGVGKTSCARIFAKTINCTSRTADGEACNECDSCRQFNENRSLNIIELDAASNNGVDDIRSLIEQVMVPPAVGRYRVFIIDEVHMLTQSAFNAFLKTLEEPPSYVVFILATTEKHKIIPTILSRCQIYDFNRIGIHDMVNHMLHVAQQEGIEADPAALNIIAQKADGAMRDALSIFDQVAASGYGKVTYQATVDNLNVLDNSYYGRLVDAFVKQDVPAALLIYKEIRSKGFDSQFFINGLGLYFRDLMVASDPSTLQLVEATDEIRAEMAARAAKLHPTFIYKAMDLCNDADFNYRQASNKQFLIELTLIKLCQLLSPSPDESGSDGGQLKPLQASTGTPTAPAAQAPAPTAAPTRPAQAPPTAPQVSQRPAPAAPRLPETPRAVPRPQSTGHSYRMGAFSLNRQAAAASTDTAARQPEAAPARTGSYSDADMDTAWRKCIDRYSAEPVIANTMRSITPERTKGDCFNLRVTSSIQADILEKEKPAMQGTLRDLLGNDFVTLEIELSHEELPSSLWTDDKVLQSILERHPRVGEFIAKYKLRLM